MSYIGIDIKESGNTVQHNKKPSLKKIVVGSLALVGSFVATTALLGNYGVQTNDALSLVSKVDPEIQQAFNQFVSKYHRSYLTKEEYRARLANFRSSFQVVKQHNDNRLKNKKTYKLALNQFADWSRNELNKMLTLQEPIDSEDDHTNDDEVIEYNVVKKDENTSDNNKDNNSGNAGLGEDDEDQQAEPQATGPPVSLDWREKGVVSSVLNQGRCGGCFAFSAASSVEAAYALKYGTLYQLSPQQIIDCTNQNEWSNAGCGGGYMTNSFKYLQSHSLMTLTDYPYVTAVNSECNYDESKGITKVASYTKLPQKDYQALFDAVQNQPISIAMYASHDDFYYYKSGVLDIEDCSVAVNHALLLVGYGHDSVTGKDYWIVKNTWGEKWGENGYVRVKRDNDGGFGMCGILKMSSFPTL